MLQTRCFLLFEKRSKWQCLLHGKEKQAILYMHIRVGYVLFKKSSKFRQKRYRKYKERGYL